MIRHLIVAVCFLTWPAHSETITAARYVEPTDRYAHGVLGDAIEWAALEITTAGQADENGLRISPVLRETKYLIRLPLDRVFEDVAPRLVDVDRDGTPEVMVVETQVDQGASLAIYGIEGKIAATPHIGTRNRWLAPVGAADLDSDGFIEIAYIDRPHLAKTLRVWRFKDGDLHQIANLEGLTNHRIGERDIGGGIRDCGTGPEMITASADWSKVMAVALVDGQLEARAIGSHTGRASLNDALACEQR